MVDVVIVNWNSGSQLDAAVDSIFKHHDELVRSVTIVDNASGDGSISRIEETNGPPFSLRVIRNKTNKGFAAACNQGARVGNAEFLLFLNPDTLLFSASISGAVSTLVAKSEQRIGICGIRLVDAFGNDSACAARFPTLRVMIGHTLGLSRVFPNLFPSQLMTHNDLQGSAFVDQVIGAFFLVRREVFELCGGFDEDFFVYFEEVDFSRRACSAGYRSYYCAEAVAFHRGGGCSDQVIAQRLFYSLRSRLIYAQKHYSPLSLLCLILLTAAELPIRLVRSIVRRSPQEAKQCFVAYWWLVTCGFGSAHDDSR